MKPRHIAIAVLGLVAVGGALTYVNKRNAPPQEPVEKSLFEAAQKGYLDQVQTFLNRGVGVDEVGARKQTPLIGSLVYSHQDVAELLIDKGADVSTLDERGLTPAHYAASNNLTEVLKTLKEKGAKMGVANSEGLTPINLANIYHSREAVEYLKSLGEKITPLAKKDKPKSRLAAGPG